MPEKKSWKMPGCRGRFYLRGKKKTIWYEANDSPRSLRLIYTGKNKEIAAEIVQKNELPKIFNPPPDSPELLLDAYEQFRDIAKRTKKPGTIIEYDNAMKGSFTYDHDLSEVINIRNDIENQLYRKKDFSKSTIRQYLRVLKAFFNYCKKQKWIEENPIDLILIPKAPPKLIEIFSDTELKVIFDYWQKFDYEFYLYIKFIYYTAFRRDEPIKLLWKNVWFDGKFRDNIMIISSKYGDKPETFPITDVLKVIMVQLKSYETREGHLFNNLGRCSIRFKRSLIKLKIENYKRHEYTRCIHTLRKTRISKWITEYKMDPYSLMKLTRDNINTVMKYYAQLDTINLTKFIIEENL